MSKDNVIPFPKRDVEVEKVLMTTDDLEVILAKVKKQKEQIKKQYDIIIKQKEEILKQREEIWQI